TCTWRFPSGGSSGNPRIVTPVCGAYGRFAHPLPLAAELADPAVGVGAGAVLQADELLPQAHGDGAGGAVTDLELALPTLHVRDGGNDGGSTAGEHLGELSTGRGLPPLVGRNPPLFHRVAEVGGELQQ